MKTATCLVFAFGALVALTPGQSCHDAAVSLMIPASASDDGSMLYDNGPMVLLRTHSHRAANSDWLKFETDACGWLQRVDNSHSLLRRSAIVDDADEPDEDDPWDSGHGLVGQWLSQHSEIAVINDAVDKSCDDSVFDTVDDDTLEIA
jgi:hypothetical protein